MGYGFHVTGLFLAQRALRGIFRPADLELYRRLIPAPMIPSRDPSVLLYVTAFDRVSPWPFTPYLEGAVLLAVQLGGREGWYTLTMPVTRRVANWGGRRHGFPKYVADEISLETGAGAATGRVAHGGRTLMELRLGAGFTRDLDPWEQRVALAPPTYATGDTPFFNFVPPQRGPRVEATVVDRLGETRELEKVEGMLDVTVDRTLPWARLVAPGTLFPASYLRAECAFTLRHSVVVRRAPSRRASSEEPGARAG